MSHRDALRQHGIDPMREERVRIIIAKIMLVVDQAGVIEIDRLIAARDPQFEVAGYLSLDETAGAVAA